MARLGRFEPTLVCVEAIPGDRVADFARSPDRYGELLRTFALDGVRLAAEQQVKLSVDAAAAREQARSLERRPGELDPGARLRLVALQLASHEPWSAALNWAALPDAVRADAASSLGPVAPARLDALVASRNEIATIAIPLARGRGHRRLCMVDTFVDELGVEALAADLMPLVDTPAVRAGMERLRREQAARWRAGDDAGLVRLLAWTNGAPFAKADLDVEWTLFATPGSAHDACKRRLSLWHARNAQIAADLYRGIASPEGARTLLIIGASHRPFVESLLASQPWTTMHPAATMLGIAD